MAKEAIRLAKWSELRDLEYSLSRRIDNVVVFGTSERWAHDSRFIPFPGQVVVWSDRGTMVPDGSGGTVSVPGVKIGDGNAYNLDLPFVGDDVAARIMSVVTAHVGDAGVHVTPEERARWNNKITTSDKVEGERLVLTRS